MTARIACLGECMMEFVEHPDGTLTRGFGGDTLNTAIYLARLGVDVDYVTALGTDPFSDEMLAAWQSEGIGTGLVRRVPDRLPGLYMIQTDARGERRFSYWRDAAPVRGLFDRPDAALTTALGGHAMLYLSGITLSLFGEAGRLHLFALLDELRLGGCDIAFDTNFRPRGWPDVLVARDAFAGMLARSDLVFVGTEDFCALYGADGSGATGGGAAAWGASGGAGEVVVKHDGPGCIVHWRGGTTSVPAPPVAAVIDTTAAGDSFAAGYIAVRRRGAAPEAAAQAGHRLAGRVVQHRGAIIPRDAMADLRVRS